MNMSRPVANTSITDSPLKILVECLAIIEKHGPIYDLSGICLNLANEMYEVFKSVWYSMERQVVKEVQEEFAAICCHWPKFSGNRDFPVPGIRTSPVDAYHATVCEGESLWVGEYGELRKELVKFALKRARQLAGNCSDFVIG
jgi:hypothetical protein